MFKTMENSSTSSRRVRMARSEATSRADTALGPRPIVNRPTSAATKRGPSRCRVLASEQSTEPLPRDFRPARSHSQDRNIRMTHETSMPGIYVGIDVAKDKLDLAQSDADDVLQFENNDRGIAQIVARMTQAKPVLIVVESTGGLERPLVTALLEADLPVSLVHPGRVRNMAKALGIHAKSDRIDARVLYLFGQKAQPRIHAKRSEKREQLSDLVACRRQLCTTRVQQSNRRGASHSPAARKSIDAIITALDRQIASLDRQIRRLIDADDDFRDLEKILLSVPGVGPKLAAALLADVPELGTIDR